MLGLGFGVAAEKSLGWDAARRRASGLIGDKLGLEGSFWDAIGGLNNNLTSFGFAVVGVFIASWLVSTIIYRAKGYDNLPIG